MKIRPLYSSSAGNACKVSTDRTNILIEAGISYKKLITADKNLNHLSAIFITHSHGDHINGAGIIARKMGTPIYMLEETFKNKKSLFQQCTVNFFKHGDKINITDLEVSVFETRHDTPSVGFIITDTNTNKSFAYLTDTGFIGRTVKEAISNCNAYLLETDYDEEELEKTAEYDDVLKERIKSPFGHLGTQQTLDFIKNNINLDKTDWIILGHLSNTTNSPELVKARLEKTIDSVYISKFYLAPLDHELTV